MMKTNLWKHAVLAAAWVAVAAGCATEDWTETPADPNNDAPQSVLHVSTPTDNDPQTRVAYDDANLKLTWQTGDQLQVVGCDNNGNSNWSNSELYNYAGTDGATSGDFTGTPPATTDGVGYNIYYPVSAYDTYGDLTFPTQTQTADNNAAHLNAALVLTATGITDLSQPFTLQMQSCIMKFALSGIPAAVGKLKMLQWSASGMPTQTLYFTTDVIDFGSSKSDLTAYLGFMPLTLPAGGKFTVTLIGDKVYHATLTSTGGKSYVAGSRYTATIAQANAWTAAPDESNYETTWTKMQFKIDTSKGENGKPSTDYTFSIPFPTSGVTPASIKVDWGDDSGVVSIAQGTPLSEGDAFDHTYVAGQEYTITVYSDQTDATQQQIPEINFLKYRTNNYTNGYKLTKIETALPNTGTADFDYCFTYCSELTTIPAELFNNNTAVTSFGGCFGECSALTAIPEGLFDNNTAVTSFESCFYRCSALTAIPEGLFDKNTAATIFKACFDGCKKVTLNKNIFSSTGSTTRFEGKNMIFNFCFENAGSEADTLGEAPELWKYDKGGSTWTTVRCFEGTNFTNHDATTDGYTAEVATAWGTPKAP